MEPAKFKMASAEAGYYLRDEASRNGSLKKNVNARKNSAHGACFGNVVAIDGGQGIENNGIWDGREHSCWEQKWLARPKHIDGNGLLSKHKAEIIWDDRVVRIPLRNGKTLRVIGERPEEKVVIDIFRPNFEEFSFISNLNPWEQYSAKSTTRLAPSKMEELSGQLRELQDKGFIQPSSLPWGALILFVKRKDGSFRNVY
ncbi:hypothetical protein Tco_1317578 [Tanacetum coccineum]|uniref:Reverse transcriptase domain-containing protein n=1 Tax=Tanacetum coccineum TaxID=301880 RepID=A0ABQ5C005_9ASTR